MILADWALLSGYVVNVNVSREYMGICLCPLEKHFVIYYLLVCI